MAKIGIAERFLVFSIFGLFLIPLIFYLVTLQKTLKEVSVENRQMQPGQVWLCLIPLFGVIWQFIMIDKIALSLKAEFKKRNVHVVEEKPGYSLGLAYCVLGCFSIIPILGFFTAVAALICWIMYWVKISNYKTDLEATRDIGLNNIGT